MLAREILRTLQTQNIAPTLRKRARSFAYPPAAVAALRLPIKVARSMRPNTVPAAAPPLILRTITRRTSTRAARSTMITAMRIVLASPSPNLVRSATIASMRYNRPQRRRPVLRRRPAHSSNRQRHRSKPVRNSHRATAVDSTSTTWCTIWRARPWIDRRSWSSGVNSGAPRTGPLANDRPTRMGCRQQRHTSKRNVRSIAASSNRSEAVLAISNRANCRPAAAAKRTPAISRPAVRPTVSAVRPIIRRRRRRPPTMTTIMRRALAAVVARTVALVLMSMRMRTGRKSDRIAKRRSRCSMRRHSSSIRNSSAVKAALRRQLDRHHLEGIFATSARNHNPPNNKKNTIHHPPRPPPLLLVEARKKNSNTCALGGKHSQLVNLPTATDRNNLQTPSLAHQHKIYAYKPDYQNRHHPLSSQHATKIKQYNNYYSAITTTILLLLLLLLLPPPTTPLYHRTRSLSTLHSSLSQPFSTTHAHKPTRIHSLTTLHNTPPLPPSPPPIPQKPFHVRCCLLLYSIKHTRTLASVSPISIRFRFSPPFIVFRFSVIVCRCFPFTRFIRSCPTKSCEFCPHCGYTEPLAPGNANYGLFVNVMNGAGCDRNAHRSRRSSRRNPVQQHAQSSSASATTTGLCGGGIGGAIDVHVYDDVVDSNDDDDDDDDDTRQCHEHYHACLDEGGDLICADHISESAPNLPASTATASHGGYINSNFVRNSAVRAITLREKSATRSASGCAVSVRVTSKPPPFGAAASVDQQRPRSSGAASMSLLLAEREMPITRDRYSRSPRRNFGGNKAISFDEAAAAAAAATAAAERHPQRSIDTAGANVPRKVVANVMRPPSHSDIPRRRSSKDAQKIR